MAVFEISQRTTELLGRAAGAEMRAALEAAVQGEQELTIDFSGVTDLSPSFADECFGKFVAELSRQSERPRLVFANVPDDFRSFVQFALANRRPEPVA